MKIRLNFTLDPKIADLLSNETNASSLVNGLLENHYYVGNKKKAEEIASEISKILEKNNENEKKLSLFRLKLQELKEKEAEIKEIFKVALNIINITLCFP